MGAIGDAETPTRREPASAPEQAGGGARIRYVVGTGGAGRTTIAAALARGAAAAGVRSVLLTTDADRLADLGPLDCDVRLVEPAAEFTERVLEWQGGARELLDHLGAQPLERDELTELPGAGPFALIRALRSAAADYEFVVVDLPPLPEAVRTLLLPGQLDRYLGRLLPPERQAARALRPVLAQLAGVPMPAQWLYERGERLRRHCAELTELLQGPGSSAVLVLEAGSEAVRVSADARAGLALAQVPLAAVVVNRTLPSHSPDPWLAALIETRRAETDRLRESLDGLPLVEVPHLGREVREATDLDALGLDVPEAELPTLQSVVEDRLEEEGQLVWRLPLPGASKERLALVRRGDEALVTVGTHRRALPLPAALRRCTVTGAKLADGVLAVRFAPDPTMWPPGR